MTLCVRGNFSTHQCGLVVVTLDTLVEHTNEPTGQECGNGEESDTTVCYPTRRSALLVWGVSSGSGAFVGTGG